MCDALVTSKAFFIRSEEHGTRRSYRSKRWLPSFSTGCSTLSCIALSSPVLLCPRMFINRQLFHFLSNAILFQLGVFTHPHKTDTLIRPSQYSKLELTAQVILIISDLVSVNKGIYYSEPKLSWFSAASQDIELIPSLFLRMFLHSTRSILGDHGARFRFSHFNLPSIRLAEGPLA